MKYVVMGRQGMVEGLIPLSILLALLVLISHCDASTHPLEHKCIHDTEEMQTLNYGPVVDMKTGQRHGFTPQGILERTVPQQYRPMPSSDAPEEVHRAFHATAVGNIRFVTSILDLQTPGKYCTRVGESVPDSQGGKMTCTADDIFTAEKKDILLNKVLPAALGMLSSALKVKQVHGNLISPGCKHYSVPVWHSSIGVPNADYVLYVSAAPTVGSTVAWAGTCLIDAAYRPVVGRANFGPKYLVWKDLDIFGQRQLVRTAVHEILHALGFSSSLWTNFFPTGNPIATESRRGKTVQYFSSKKVVEKARKYYNCQKLNGPEIEDEGGGGTGGSHWKRRNHMDDMMGGVANHLMFLSPITLAVMEDSGHYTVDWSKVETPKWMYRAGCGVLNEKCNTKAGGLGKYFCNDGLDSCTSDHRSIGQCHIGLFSGNLPSWAQYFPGEPTKGGVEPLMDYCPVVRSFSNNQCDNPVDGIRTGTIIPEYYANDGRCFETTGVIKSGYLTSSLAPANCLQTRCVSNVVEFKMPDNAAWIACPFKGAQITLLPYGYYGILTCPDPDIMCDGVEINAPVTTLYKITTTEFQSNIIESAISVSSTILAVVISSFVFLGVVF